MKTSDQGIELIKGFEGFSAEIYEDFAGYPTIGFGHKIRPGDKFPPMLTEAEGTVLLCTDLVEYESCVSDSVTVELNQDQFDALVSFCYNVGCHAFKTSTLINLLNAGMPMEASEQLQRWDKAGGKTSPILAKRREIERQIFIAGYQDSAGSLPDQGIISDNA